ncbi:MAG: hypothetical protein LBR13_00785 [Dysgonamonadaceae bacterium]|nr:hypothetical protein [Dysgonamonadaceae bacterium]
MCIAFVAIALAPQGAYAEGSFDLAAAKAKLENLKETLDNVSSEAKESNDYTATLQQIAAIEQQIADYEEALEENSTLSAAKDAAQAEADKYAEGTVTRSQWSENERQEGSLFKTTYRDYYAAYTLDLNNQGGSIWREKVGFGSVTYLQYGPSKLAKVLGTWDAAEAAALLIGVDSEIGKYYAATQLGDAADAAKDAFYGSDYTTARDAAKTALSEATQALQAKEDKISDLEEELSNLDDQLAALEKVVQQLAEYDLPENAPEPTVAINDVVGPIYVGIPFKLSAEVATPPVGSLSFQWFAGSDEIVGATGPSYNAIVTEPGTVTYTVVVTNTCTEEQIKTGGELTAQAEDAIDVEVLPLPAFGFEESVISVDINSENEETYALPDVKGAIGDVTYEIVETVAGITLDENTLKIKKDLNKGSYTVKVKAIDSARNLEDEEGEEPVGDELTINFNVSNRYDDAKDALVAELDEMKAKVDEIAALAGSLPSESVALITAAQAAIDLAYNTVNSIWNDGDPVIDVKSLLESLGVPTIVTSKLTNPSPSISKQEAIEGYTFTLVNTYTLSPIGTTVDLARTAYNALLGIYNGQLSLLAELTDAVTDLQNYLTTYDYQSINSVEKSDEFIQTLATKYNRVDEALNALNDSEGLAKAIAEAFIENLPSLISQSLELVKPSVVSQLSNLDPRIQPLAEQILDQLFGEAEGQIANLPELTLADIVEYSGLINEALQKLTQISTLAINISQFDYKSFLEQQLAQMQSDFESRLAELQSELSAELQARLQASREQLRNALAAEIANIREQISASGTLEDVLAILDEIQEAAAIGRQLIENAGSVIAQARETLAEINAAIDASPCASQVRDAVLGVVGEIATISFEEFAEAATVAVQAAVSIAQDYFESHEYSEFVASVRGIAESAVAELQATAQLISAQGEPVITFADLTFESPYATFSTNYDELLAKLSGVIEILESLGAEIGFKIDGDVPFAVEDNYIIGTGDEVPGTDYDVTLSLVFKAGACEFVIATGSTTISTVGTIDLLVEDYEGDYDGTAHSVTVTVDPADAVIYYSTDDVDYSTTLPEFTRPGVYTVYVKVEKDGYITTEGSATVTINALNMTLAVSGYNDVYDWNTHSITVNVDPADAMLLYSEDGGTSWTLDLPEYSSPGEYQVYVMARREGYYDANGNATIIINKINASGLDFSFLANATYTGQQITGAVELEYNGVTLVEGVDFEIVSWGENVNVDDGGSVTIKGLGVFDGEYTFYFGIQKAQPQDVVFPSSVTITYFDGITLEDVDLDGLGSGDGYFEWQTPATPLSTGSYQFTAVFVPRDSQNYDYDGVDFEGDVTVIVDDPVITGLATAENAALKASVKDGLLKVTGINAGSLVKVYSLQGALVKQVESVSSETYINLPARGIYLVAADGKKVKVIY